MPGKQNIEIHNEEVREIMQEIPGRLIRWGLTVIFLVFASIIIGSYFFTFKDIVSAPLIITTTNPPAPIICKTSGRIQNWFVNDGQFVTKGQEIALLENSAQLSDLKKAQNFIQAINIDSLLQFLQTTFLPPHLELGEIQEQYNAFSQNWQGYKKYIDGNYLPKKIDLQKQQNQKQHEHYRLMLKQQKMMSQELEITRSGLKRYQKLVNKGGVSESQLEEERSRVIQAERGYTGFLASLKNTEIGLINQERSLLELQEQFRKETGSYEANIKENIQSLIHSFADWKNKYLLSSPVNGKLTQTKYWSENHVVVSGDRLATVVPADSSMVICRAMVNSAGIGKIEKGQKVHIILAGYPSMEHGKLSGVVSAVSLVPETEGYVVEIQLNHGMVSSYREQLKLVQEMEGTAEIITGEMRMIYRFINPIKMLFKQ